jgi:3-isopropylmalate/(R)-2-methylmalate dehydratase small subunit
LTPFITHQGRVAALRRRNVDTDQIIPKQFLKRIERTGFGPFLFYNWRIGPDGRELSEFVLNRPEAAGATILLTGENFGCGSSREHAPWALADYGFRVIVAPSFADIFYNNCFQTGLLPVVLGDDILQHWYERYDREHGLELRVDLQEQLVSDAAGRSIPFSVDPYRKAMLLRGLDEIGQTLLLEEQIAAFEQAGGAAW